MPTPTLPPTPIVIDDFCLLASNCGGQGQANHTDAGRAPTRGSGTGQVSLPRTGEGLGPLALLALAAMAAGAGFVLLGARRGPATTSGRALSRSADSSR
jgi:LPXTG-motif cell wall-anchored protein